MVTICAKNNESVMRDIIEVFFKGPVFSKMPIIHITAHFRFKTCICDDLFI
jgi:hypothetical protein